jgi:hypothetical protein
MAMACLRLFAFCPNGRSEGYRACVRAWHGEGLADIRGELLLLRGTPSAFKLREPLLDLAMIVTGEMWGLIGTHLIGGAV